MTRENSSITMEQLARLFDAANKANSELAAAHRQKPRDPDLIIRMRQRSSTLNSAYDAARRQYRRQQKNAHKSAMTTTMIKFYMDYAEAKNEGIIL